MVETVEDDRQRLSQVVGSKENPFDLLATEVSRRRGLQALGLLATSLLVACGLRRSLNDGSGATPSPVPTRRPLKERIKESYDGGPQDDKSYEIRLNGPNHFRISTPLWNITPDDDLDYAFGVLTEQCPDARIVESGSRSRLVAVSDDSCFPPLR